MWAAAIAQGTADAADAGEALVTHRPGAPGVVCGTLNLLGEDFNPFEFIATGDKEFMGKFICSCAMASRLPILVFRLLLFASASTCFFSSNLFQLESFQRTRTCLVPVKVVFFSSSDGFSLLIRNLVRLSYLQNKISERRLYLFPS